MRRSMRHSWTTATRVALIYPLLIILGGAELKAHFHRDSQKRCTSEVRAKNGIETDDFHQSYRWFRLRYPGIDLPQIMTPELVDGLLLRIDCPASRQEPWTLASACIGSTKTLFVEMSSGDTPILRRLEIVPNPSPEIEVTSDARRGRKLTLKTTETYSSYEWFFAGYGDPRFEDQAEVGIDNLRTATLNDLANENPRRGTKLRRESGEAIPVAAGIRKKDLREELETLNDGSTLHHPVFSPAVYSVTVKDSNGCRGSAIEAVTVDQYRVEFFGGIDFARLTQVNGEPTTEETDDSNADSGMQGEEASVEESKQGDLFSNNSGFVGLRWDHYFLDSVKVMGNLRFGGTDIQVGTEPVEALTQADTFQASFGLQWDPTWTCAPAHQFCLYLKAEYGVIFPEQKIARSDAGESGETVASTVVSEDQLDRSFAGIGWRYDRPGARFHGSYLELGIGRSDNFLDENQRVKTRGAVMIDLPTEWDLVLMAELDSDSGSGPDNLRVVFGARRDASFLGEMIAKALGIADE